MVKLVSRLVQGVGINDSKYTWVDGQKCPFYSRWQDMLKRCYSASYHKKKPSYIGCYVCDEWLTFSKFKKWMRTQDWQGKHLDKDLISEGNLVYSPDTCLFLSPEVNQFINTGGKRNGLLMGVTWIEEKNRFRAQVGGKGYIGHYNTEKEAHRAYCEAKRNLAVDLAKSQDPRVSELLLKRFGGVIK